MAENVLDSFFRRCIFCGEVSAHSTEEHVIPRWLIRMTGDPGRQANFAQVHTPALKLKVQKQPFARFKFPACQCCNAIFGIMEVLAGRAVETLCNTGALSVFELEDLMDWLDKIRLGYWLSQLHMEKNRYQIPPKFFIRDMVGRCDMLLWIFIAQEASCGVNIFGGGLDFLSLPNTFAISISNVVIVQYSETGAGAPFYPEIPRTDTPMTNSTALEYAEAFSHLVQCAWPAPTKNCAHIFRPRQRSFLGDGDLSITTAIGDGFYRITPSRIYQMTPDGLERIPEGCSWSRIVWSDADEMRLQAIRTFYRVRKHALAAVNFPDPEHAKAIKACAEGLGTRFEEMSAADFGEHLKNPSIFEIKVP
jgi:hypothetical protein